MEESMQWASLDSLEQGEEMRNVEAVKRGGKENKWAEDHLMNHQEKALAKAVGLQKVQSSGVWERSHS